MEIKRRFLLYEKCLKKFTYCLLEKMNATNSNLTFFLLTDFATWVFFTKSELVSYGPQSPQRFANGAMRKK
jgi:hypothetical protein